MNDTEYAGFWIRAGASIIDSLLIMMITVPAMLAIYGPDYWESTSLFMGAWDLLVNYVFPAAAVITFWVYKSATPGKMACRLVIVDAKTGNKPSTGQLIGRYFAYYLSLIPLGLGYIWVAFDKRKQGFHDKLAGTVVLRTAQQKEAVQFDSAG